MSLFFFLISTQSYQGIKLVELVDGVCWGCLFFFLISTQSYQGIKLVELVDELVDGVCWGCLFFFLISTQSYQGIKLVELVDEGRQNVHDDERSGRPVTATDNAAVAAVRNVVEADRRVTIDEIMIRLPPGIEIGRSSIRTIMSDVLNYRKVCARWVPRLLSENHKQQRMEAARAFLEMHWRDGDQLFSRIVTGDKSWVHHSTPEIKRQSMVWKKPEESAPKKRRRSQSKVMAIVFWDCKGVLLVYYLPPNTTVNAARNCEVLTKLRAAIKRKRPGLLSRKVLLVHDNARPHAARTTQTLLENFKWEIFTHPPYSQDLASSDFHLFPALKLLLGGNHFANDDEVQAEANHWLRRQDTAWYNSGIQKLLQRYQIYFDRNGDYMSLFFFLISTQSYQGIKLVELVDGVCWGRVSSSFLSPLNHIRNLLMVSVLGLGLLLSYLHSKIISGYQACRTF
ncbi:hypothetical protein LAZ67_3004375 [Cordylochernes scorpioides]|uniref:Transposase n=1 Tax=Cordylochernes scorpioides TaxID=51811 RepID=A0ABY6K9E3_9ARAC|nr:hypothetical protein LAZ67_3004375 [Cordylochernes scorpioides]